MYRAVGNCLSRVASNAIFYPFLAGGERRELHLLSCDHTPVELLSSLKRTPMNCVPSVQVVSAARNVGTCDEISDTFVLLWERRARLLVPHVI